MPQMFSFYRFRSALILASLLALTLSACGGGGGGLAGSNPVPVTPAPGTTNSAASKIGTGTGTSFQEGVINASETGVDAGETITLRVNAVDTGNQPPTQTATVTFSSPCVANGLSTFGTQTEITPGLFSITYRSNGCDGNDIVTAVLTGTSQVASVTLSTVGPQVLTVSFVEATTTQLSLAGIGGNESTELTFLVAGAQGVPVVGKQVNFSINTNVGGAAILAGRESALTDQSGLVRTILRSGTIAGPVNVLATHAESGRSGLSQDIIISTGIPVANRFSLSYAPQNPLNAFRQDGIQSTLSIIASDTFGNDVTDGTRISFVSPESGNVNASCLLVAGACSVVWRSSTPRPANGRLTVIGYTDGAEAFTDNNGNKVFDAGDTGLVDQGEPFADENENGAYDVGEYFFDTNSNGVRDGGNGLWDGPCLDKVAATAICTGEKTATIFGSVVIVMSTNTPSIKNLGTFPAPGNTITLAQGTSRNFSGLVVGDDNANAGANNPMPIGTTIRFQIEGSGATLQGSSTETLGNYTGPSGPYGTNVVAATVAPTANLPANVNLVLSVEVPGEVTWQFRWPLSITR
jgi:hypothetical protein